MGENKTVSRFIWLHPWQIPEQEAWLEDLARQGFGLEKLGGLRATFRRDKPANIRFRIDIFNSFSAAARERIDVYRQAGWHYAGNRWLMQFFYADEDAKVPDLHTDSQEHALTIKELKRGVTIRTNLTIFLSLLVFTFLLSSMLFPLTGNSLGFLLQDRAFHILGSLVIYGYITYINISAVIYLSRMVRMLQNNEPLVRNQDYKRAHFGNRNVTLVAFLLGAILTFAPIYHLTNIFTEQYPPFPSGEEVSVVRLHEIEGTRELVPDIQTVPGHGDIGNFLFESSGILVPRQYRARENATVPGKTWPDENAQYSPSLNSQLYVARSDFVAERLFNLMVESEERDLFRGAEPQLYYDRYGFEAIWILESQYYNQFIMLLEDQVMYLRYSGLEPLETVITLAYDKLAR